MANIAVDIDDTLYDFNELSREVLADMARETGDRQLIQAAYAPWTEWRAPADLLSNTEGFPQKWLDIIDRCHTDEMITQQIPFRGAYNVLWNLIDNGHNITYITNRSPSAYGATARWLENCDFPHDGNISPSGGAVLGDRVQLICTTEAKIPLLRNCQYIIDDRPKTLIEFVYDYDWKNKHGSTQMPRKGFGLHKEYNGNLTDVPGIYLAKTWNLLETFMIEKGLIREPKLAAL